MNGDGFTLINVASAAQILNVPKSTMYKLVKSKEVPYLKVGKHIRFKPDHLYRWIDSHGESV